MLIFAVTFETQPRNFQRLRVIVVVSLNLFLTTLARQPNQPATPDCVIHCGSGFVPVFMQGPMLTLIFELSLLPVWISLTLDFVSFILIFSFSVVPACVSFCAGLALI
jgi:hypothetical protein